MNRSAAAPNAVSNRGAGSIIFNFAVSDPADRQIRQAAGNLARVLCDRLRHAVVGSKDVLGSLEIDAVERNRAVLADNNIAGDAELRIRFIAGRHIADQQRAAVEFDPAHPNGTCCVCIEGGAGVELYVRSGKERRIIRRMSDIKGQVAERKLSAEAAECSAIAENKRIGRAAEINGESAAAAERIADCRGARLVEHQAAVKRY